MEGNKRAFKGVWICAAVWTDPDLSWPEKALVAEVDSLVSEHSPCFASNEHLAKRIGVSVSRINDMLARLQKAGFLVRVQYDGRTTHRVVSAAYSSDPEMATRWIRQRTANSGEKENYQKQESRVPENRNSDFLLSANETSQNQQDWVPQNRKSLIKRIPEENAKREFHIRNDDDDNNIY